MSIFHTDPIIQVNSNQRSAKLTWTLGEGADFDGDHATKVAQLSIWHDKDDKRFTASVQRVDVGQSGGFRVEKFAPFSGTRFQLSSTPCARFSAKAFDAAVSAALTELRTRADEPAIAAVANPESPA